MENIFDINIIKDFEKNSINAGYFIGKIYYVITKLRLYE